MKREKPVLLGSTFPLSLIRRPVTIEPQALEELRLLLESRPVASFWGHRSTVQIASSLLGVDVTPSRGRPAIRLDTEGYPVLDGEVFDECWVLSPDYEPGFRPPVGGAVDEERIAGWRLLRIRWQ